MTIFHVAIIFISTGICTALGAGIGWLFGTAHIELGALLGTILGVLSAFTPYPLRLIFWVFSRTKEQKSMDRSENPKQRGIQ